MAWKRETWQELTKAWLEANAKANAKAKAEAAAKAKDGEPVPWTPKPATPGGAAVALGLSTGTTHNWFHGKACPHWNDAENLAKAMGLPLERIRRAINTTKGPNPKHAAQAKASKAAHSKKAAPVAAV